MGTIDFDFVESIFAEFCPEDKREFYIECKTKYERADVLRVLVSHGYDINHGIERPYHLQPDSLYCNFSYPHVSVTRYEGETWFDCSCATPKASWTNAEAFLEFASSFDRCDELPDVEAILQGEAFGS